MSAHTSRESPTSRFTAYRPQFSSGSTFSMTIFRVPSMRPVILSPGRRPSIIGSTRAASVAPRRVGMDGAPTKGQIAVIDPGPAGPQVAFADGDLPQVSG